MAVWREHVGAALGIYDLRRSFAVWMEDSGIPRSRQRLYMGHAVGDVTGLYQTRELLSWLPEDAERVRDLARQSGLGRKFPDMFPDTIGAGVATPIVAA